MALAAMVFHMADASCQRIGVRMMTGNNEITVTALFPASLQFDQLIVDSETASQIELGGYNDERVLVVAVDAPENGSLLVTATASHPSRLYHEHEKTSHIPFQLNLAYSNAGYPANHTDIRSAKAQAIKVEKGLNSFIFPANSSFTGLYAKDPLSVNDKNASSKTRVYLFFFGSIGPVTSKNQVVAGIYETDIMVNVEHIANVED